MYDTLSSRRDSLSRSLLLSTLAILEGLDAFMQWLYTNDEELLYHTLANGNEASSTYTLHFCQLAKIFGCVNYRLAGVVRAVYEAA